MKNKFLMTIVLAGSLVTSTATAAIQCYDTVTDVVVHSNGRTFFTTANACSLAWCELAGDTTFMTQGYAMLMVAKIKSKTLMIQWNGISSCDAKNVAYAIPEFMILK